MGPSGPFFLFMSMAKPLSFDSGTRCSWRLLPAGLYIALVPLLSLLSHELGGHDFARLSQVLLGGLCALAWAIPARAPTGWSSAVWLGSGLCFALATASVALAEVPTMALRELTLVLGAVCLVAVVASASGAMQVCASLTSATSALYGALVLGLAGAALIAGSPPDRTSLFVGYDNYRFFNHVQTAALPMALAAACCQDLTAGQRRVARFALVSGWSLVFASAGRGTFCALVISTLIVWVTVGRGAWPSVRLFARTMLAGLAVFVALFLAAPWLVSAGVPPMPDYAPARMTSDQSRLYLWRVAWQQILSSPWLGIGPMHGAHWPNLKAAHPHNVYLQLASEWGLPASAVVMAAAGRLLYRMLNAIRAGVRAPLVGTALLIACGAVSVDGLVSGNFVMPVSQVWIAVLVGWSLSWLADQRPTAVVQTPSPDVAFGWSTAFAALTLLMHLWLAWVIAPEVRDLEAHLRQERDTFLTERTQPRFWSRGRF